MQLVFDHQDLKDLSVYSPVLVLKISWAVVISNYIDSQYVLFGVGEQSNIQYPDISPVRLHVRPENIVNDILRETDWIDSSPLKSEEQYHSILIIRSTTAASQSSRSFEGGNRRPLTIFCDVKNDGIYIENISDDSSSASKLLNLILYHWRHVIREMAKNPLARLAELQGLSPEEIELLHQWNSKTEIRREESCAHHLIERQCKEQPSAPAVHSWDGALTYNQLDSMATQVAARLVAAGIGPEKFVALLIEKSMWMTVAVLAVMKAGGAFVLLDASQPVQRLALMCRKTQSRVVLVSEKHAAIASGLDLPVIGVPDDVFLTDRSSTSVPFNAPDVRPHHPLYAGFTSGSTGEPKGFVIEHCAFTSGLDAYLKASRLKRESRVLQFASYAFVVSITDQIASLAAGACVCVPSEGQLQNDLAGCIQELNANWLKVTPTVLRLLSPQTGQNLISILLVGERVDRSELVKWQGHASLFSLYGQSENAKGTMVNARTSPDCDLQNLGRPFAATPWIVNSHDPNRLVPVGAEGELLLEGPCLSRGYLDAEEQNRITFLQDPPWLYQMRPEQTHGRFLRTGDLARFHENGTIVLLGRKGTRVKIRGQRVELAEVEHHLCKFIDASEPVIAEVIVPSDQEEHNAMLLAFVPVGGNSNDGKFIVPPTTPFRNQMLDTSAKLKEVLLAFMVPASFVPIRAVPRTPTGKLHRRLLRDEASKLTRQELLASMRSEAPHQLPKTEAEKTLQQVCADVLKLPLHSVGMQVGFFDLGGDSITARELVIRLRHRNVSVAVTDVFLQTSLASLAECHNSSADEVQADPTTRPDPFAELRVEFMKHEHPTLIHMEVEDVLPTAPYQVRASHNGVLDYFAFDLAGNLDVSQLQQACEALVQNHAGLRSAFIPFQDSFVQVVLRHVNVPFLRYNLKNSQTSLEDWAASFCKSDWSKSHTLDRPHVLFALAQSDTELNHAMFVIRASHAQTDGLALNPLLSDIWNAYGNLPIPEPGDPSRYARDCYWERTPAAWAFWQHLLRGSTVTQIPLPRAERPETPLPRRELKSSFPAQPSGTTTTLLLAPGDCAFWEKRIPMPTVPKGFTMSTVLKTAWAHMLHTLTGDYDLLFAQIVNSRNTNTPNVDRLISCCANVAPVRVQVNPSSSMCEVLRAVQSIHAQSIPYETIWWDDMPGNCTDWPKGTKPSSYIFCQNFDRISSGQVGSLQWRKALTVLPIVTSDTLVLEAYFSNDSLLLLLCGEHNLASEENAAKVLDLCTKSIESICNNPDGLFVLPTLEYLTQPAKPNPKLL